MYVFLVLHHSIWIWYDEKYVFNFIEILFETSAANRNYDFRLIHLLFIEIFLYYGAQKFLYWGLATEISVPHSTENFCEK